LGTNLTTKKVWTAGGYQDRGEENGSIWMTLKQGGEKEEDGANRMPGGKSKLTRGKERISG